MLYCPKPGGILSLDLSMSSTGWSVGDFGERPVFGHWELGRMSDQGSAYAVLEDRIDDAIKIYRPRLVAYEAPLPTHRKIDKQNPHATRQTNDIAIMLIRLGGVVELICARHEIAYYHQNCTEARRKVLGRVPTGKSEQVKAEIMAWARRRGWQIKNDDEADSLLLLQYAVVEKDRSSRAHFNRHGDIL